MNFWTPELFFVRTGIKCQTPQDSRKGYACAANILHIHRQKYRRLANVEATVPPTSINYTVVDNWATKPMKDKKKR